MPALKLSGGGLRACSGYRLTQVITFLGLEHQDEQVGRFLSLRGTFVCLLPSSSA